MTITLDDSVTVLEGVGSTTARRLADAFDIATVRDLLTHFPRRYHDAGEVLEVQDVVEGEPATLLGEVMTWSSRRTAARGRKRPMEISEGTVRQASGETFTVTFFNQMWRAKQLPAGTVAAFSGKVTRFRGRLQLASPDAQILGRVSDNLDAASAAQRLEHQRLLAVYPSVDKLPSFALADMIEQALELVTIDDWLDASIRREHALVTLDTAFRAIHRPPDRAEARRARDRLVFDELLTLQLGIQSRRVQLEADAAGLENRATVGGWAERFFAACRLPQPMRSSAQSQKSARTWPGRAPCIGCCRATSARERRSLRCGRCSRRSTPAGKLP
jgi:ATP-dependent DNA helicase RecG